MSGMKKFFGLGLLALLTTAYLTSSCSRDEFSGSIIESKKEAFSENFKAAYGNINPNQDWGFGSANSFSRAFTRTISVNGDDYAKFPSGDEIAAYFPTAIPENADEVSDLETLYKGKTVTTAYGEITMYDLYAIYANKIVEGYNLKVTSTGSYANGIVELGGTYQNSGYDSETNRTVAYPYNVYVDVDGDLIIRRNGATHFNLYILNGNVTIESEYKEQAGVISVAEGATLTDERNSIAANQGIKLFNRGTVNATNTQGYDIGNFSIVYNEGKFNVTGPLTYSPADANNSYFMNLGDNAELTAPAMTLNSTGNFYNDGKVTITGETNVTQQQIFWVNAGHYTTGTMTFSAQNNTFYNYCQLIVEGYAHMYDGEFNLMNNSYTEAGSAGMDNFEVKMHSNTGMHIKGNVRMIAQGDGTFQGFSTEGSNDYLLIDGKVTVDAHKKTFSITSGITYSINEIKIVRDGVAITEEYLQSVGDGAYPVLDFNGTECAYGELTVTPNTETCGATWSTSGTPIPKTTTRIHLKECGRVFCEDLGNVTKRDMDYNDVVFDAWIYMKEKVTESGEVIESEHYRTYIQLLAAGGTFAIDVANQGEVHTKFGADQDQMVNTYIEGSSPASLVDMCVTKPLPKEMVLTTELKKFYEREGGACLKNIPIFVKQGNEVEELTAIVGEAPQKYRATLGTKWAGERIAIDAAYPYFMNWVNNIEEPWENFVEANLYDVSELIPTGYYDLHPEYMDEVIDDDDDDDDDIPGIDNSPSFTLVEGSQWVTATISENGNTATVSASSLNNAPAATIYVYGTGSGSVTVNGETATDVSSAPRFNLVPSWVGTRSSSETPVVKSVALTPKQMGGSGLTIVGNGFTIYKVSYDASQTTVEKPAGTLLFSGTQNMYDWGVNLLRIDKSHLTGITAGSKIHLAGVGYAEGPESWQAQIAVGYPWLAIGTRDYWNHDERNLVFELNQAQADSLASGDLVIQGINFVLKYVTIENPSAPNPGEPTITPPASYTWAGTQAFGSNEGYLDLLNTEYSSVFNNVGEGTVITVYGYGNASNWSVQFSEYMSWGRAYRFYEQTGSSVNEVETISTTLNASQAANLKTQNGLSIIGKNFTVKYVVIDNSNVAQVEVPTPPTTGTSIWSVTEYTNQSLVGYESFSGLTDSTPANLYISGSRGQWYWEAKIYRDNTSFAIEAKVNQSDNINSSWGHWSDDALANTAEGYVALPLTGDDVNFIKQNGLQIWLNNITITKIELRQ